MLGITVVFHTVAGYVDKVDLVVFQGVGVETLLATSQCIQAWIGGPFVVIVPV